MVRFFTLDSHLKSIKANNDHSSNMLYPKEDRNNNKLMFACRTCQFSEEAVSSCVFRNNLYNTVGETAGVTQDVGSDPTVSLFGFCILCGQVIQCPQCGGGDNVWAREDFMDGLLEDAAVLEELISGTDDQVTRSESEQCNASNNYEAMLTRPVSAAAKVEQAMPKLP